MDDRNNLLATFSRAANRRASEISRLAQRQREDLAREIRAVRTRHFADLRQAREQQAARRETDMASARQAIITQKWRLDLRPPDTPQARRIDLDRVENLAACEVDAANAQQIAHRKVTMRQEVSAATDSFLGRQPVFATERESIDLARVRWSELRSAARCDAPEREDGGHER